MMLKREKPVDREWEAFLKKEKKMLYRYKNRKEPFLEKRLSSLVPDGLSKRLEEAFETAFYAVLSGGTGLIEKTYSREKMELEHKARAYKTDLMPTGRNIRENAKIAGRQNRLAAAAAGAGGAGLGFLGIGIPDIPLFLAALFRSLYKLCLLYGVDYEKPEEKELLLEMTALALCREDDFMERDAALNRRIYKMASDDWKRKWKISEEEQGKKDRVSEEKSRAEGVRQKEAKKQVSREAVRKASRALSGELLYLKFLQGIAIVGVIGGAYDSIYLSRISNYVSLKLERRYLITLGFSIKEDSRPK